MMRALNPDLSELATLMFEAKTDLEIDLFNQKLKSTSAPDLYELLRACFTLNKSIQISVPFHVENRISVKHIIDLPNLDILRFAHRLIDAIQNCHLEDRLKYSLQAASQRLLFSVIKSSVKNKYSSVEEVALWLSLIPKICSTLNIDLLETLNAKSLLGDDFALHVIDRPEPLHYINFRHLANTVLTEIIACEQIIKTQLGKALVAENLRHDITSFFSLLPRDLTASVIPPYVEETSIIKAPLIPLSIIFKHAMNMIDEKMIHVQLCEKLLNLHHRFDENEPKLFRAIFNNLFETSHLYELVFAMNAFFKITCKPGQLFNSSEIHHQLIELIISTINSYYAMNNTDRNFELNTGYDLSSWDVCRGELEELLMSHTREYQHACSQSGSKYFAAATFSGYQLRPRMINVFLYSEIYFNLNSYHAGGQYADIQMLNQRYLNEAVMMDPKNVITLLSRIFSEISYRGQVFDTSTPQYHLIAAMIKIINLYYDLTQHDDYKMSYRNEYNWNDFIICQTKLMVISERMKSVYTDHEVHLLFAASPKLPAPSANSIWRRFF